MRVNLIYFSLYYSFIQISRIQIVRYVKKHTKNITYSQKKEWSIEVDPKIFQRLELTDKNFKITMINVNLFRKGKQ